jgi:hypothetical protein
MFIVTYKGWLIVPINILLHTSQSNQNFTLKWYWKSTILTILLYPAQLVNPFMLPAYWFRTSTKKTPHNTLKWTPIISTHFQLQTFMFSHFTVQSEIFVFRDNSTRHEICWRFRLQMDKNHEVQVTLRKINHI